MEPASATTSDTTSGGVPPLGNCPYVGGTFSALDTSLPKLQPVQVQNFEQARTLKELFENGQARAKQEFRLLGQLFTFHKGKAMFNPCPHLNIYSDVSPYAETAVILRSDKNATMDRAGAMTVIDDDHYINACHIKSAFNEHPHETKDPYGLIICTQGPQGTTVDHFWRMVVQNNVGKIVTLCHEIGSKDGFGGGDCVQYFPREVGKKVKGLSSFDLELDDARCDDQKHIHKRLVKVLHPESGECISEVEHLHFKSWPDWQVPVKDSMLGFQALIKDSADFIIAEHNELENQWEASKGTYQPKRLLVHCKAGIGRTGTTVSLINAVTLIKLQQAKMAPPPSQVFTVKQDYYQRGIMLSPFSIVRRLREQRVYMCQTDNQYEYIYQFLEQYQF